MASSHCDELSAVFPAVIHEPYSLHAAPEGFTEPVLSVGGGGGGASTMACSTESLIPACFSLMRPSAVVSKSQLEDLIFAITIESGSFACTSLMTSSFVRPVKAGAPWAMAELTQKISATKTMATTTMLIFADMKRPLEESWWLGVIRLGFRPFGNVI